MEDRNQFDNLMNSVINDMPEAVLTEDLVKATAKEVFKMPARDRYKRSFGQEGCLNGLNEEGEGMDSIMEALR